MSYDEFLNLANSQSSGYLKEWKARSMLRTLHEIPSIKENPERLRKWVANCLEMEGFSQDGINTITKAITDNE